MIKQISMIGASLGDIQSAAEKEMEHAKSLCIEVSPSTENKNAVIYGRISSGAQDEISIIRQIAECWEKLQSLKYNIIRVYIDKAQSAWNNKATKRKCFAEIMEAAQRNEFAAVCVRDRNRFSRQKAFDSLLQEKTLNSHGVTLITVINTIPTPETPEEEQMYDLIKMVNALSANKTSSETSHNARTGVLTNIANGYWSGGTPYGYKLVYDASGKKAKPKLAIDEDEAPAIRFIFTQYASGATISSIIDGVGQIAKPRKGGVWLQPQISDILAREMYIGIVTWRSKGKDAKTVTATCPAIINQAIWAQVQTRREQNKRHGARQAGNTQRPFTGLIKCGVCGSIFRSKARNQKKVDGKWEYTSYGYQCACRDLNYHRRHKIDCNNRIIVDEEYLTNRSRLAVYNAFYNPEGCKKAYEQAKDNTRTKKTESEQRISEIDRQIKVLQARLAKWVDNYELNDLPLARDRIKTLQDEIKANTTKKQQIEREMQTMPDLPPFPDFMQWWGSKVDEIMTLTGPALRKRLIDIGFVATVQESGIIDMTTTLPMEPNGSFVRGRADVGGRKSGKAKSAIESDSGNYSHYHHQPAQSHS